MGRKPSTFTVSENALRQVPLEDIKVDKNYQRDVIPQHKKIVANFVKEALGIPLVAQREDGSLWIVDGLQRISALKKLGKKTVRAEVFASKGPEHEAEVFKIVNKNRTALKPLQIYTAMLTAGDEEAWAVKGIVEDEFGFTIPRLKDRTGPVAKSALPPDKAALQVSCINAVFSIYRSKNGGPAALRFCCSVIKESWPADPERTRDRMFLGLFSFWYHREKTVDVPRLVSRLAATTPGKIFYSAQLGAGDLASNLADVIERFYRKRSPQRH